MSTPAIESVPDLWSVDGSLRDIYFLNASPIKWKQFVEFVQSYPTRYTFDGQPAAMPAVSEIFANRNGSHLLAICIGRVTLHCHFFIESEIELDAEQKKSALN